MVRIVRSYPEPASLMIEKAKSNGRYDLPDVTERLCKDFHNKCYICETKPLQDPQIEHLIPHKGGKYRDRMFDWENLFWSCARCNRIKNKKLYDEGILNCCKTDPEKVIRLEYDAGNIYIISEDASDAIVERTVTLLNEVYNSMNTGMRIITCSVRIREVEAEMNRFYDILSRYVQDRGNRIVNRILYAMLSRDSAYAAFKRSYVRSHYAQYPELLQFISQM